MPLESDKPLLLSILKEINQICVDGPDYASREKARNFYESVALPSLLVAYIDTVETGSKASTASHFGMSTSTLNSILTGSGISENMLFRIRNAIEMDLNALSITGQKKNSIIYPGDWRRTTTTDIQNAIARTSESLIFLKRTIEQSNALKASDSPVDSIQIAQLIALLEATIASLKAPLVEKVQTKGILQYILKFGKKTAEKKIDSLVDTAIDKALETGKDLLDKLENAPSVDDIGNIIT